MSCPTCKDCGKAFHLKKGLRMHELRVGHNGVRKMPGRNGIPTLPLNRQRPGFATELNDVGGLVHSIWAALNEVDRQLLLVRNALGIKEPK